MQHRRHRSARTVPKVSASLSASDPSATRPRERLCPRPRSTPRTLHAPEGARESPARRMRVGEAETRSPALCAVVCKCPAADAGASRVSFSRSFSGTRFPKNFSHHARGRADSRPCELDVQQSTPISSPSESESDAAVKYPANRQSLQR
jgi:hypothetical protein